MEYVEYLFDIALRQLQRDFLPKNNDTGISLIR